MRLFSLTVILACMANLSAAQDIEEARAAYRAGDFHEAYALAAAAAADGDDVAQNLMGVMLIDGEGIPQDVSRAEEYYRAAIAQGNVFAMANLADAYLDGTPGLTVTAEETLDLLERATAAGNAGATNGLGLFHHRGISGTPDYALAMQHYLVAHELGELPATANIGNLIVNGEGVVQDYEIARQWFQIAADGGLIRAMMDLGYMHRRGLGGPECGLCAIEIYEQAAAQGSVIAVYWLGYIFENGYIDVPRDLNRAIDYYMQATALGDDYAPFNLGWIYEFSMSGTPDYRRSFGYYSLSLERGNTEAYYELARAFWDGLGVAVDLQEARRLMGLGAESGMPIAMNDLGIMYWDGIGGPVDYAAAERAFSRAVRQDYALAAINMAEILSEAQNPSQDLVRAYAHCLHGLDLNAQEETPETFDFDCASIAAQLSPDAVSAAEDLRSTL